MNVNSVGNKLHFINNLIGEENLHLMSITETWLTENCCSSFFNLPGFSFYRGDVFGVVRKHGAGIYVKDSIKHAQVEVQMQNLVIIYLVELELYVVSVYRPPSYSPAENHSLIEFLMDFSVGKELLVLGDFNLPSLPWPLVETSTQGSYVTPTDREFLECFLECGWTQWVGFGTFFPSGNTLDLVLTSDDDRIGEVYASEPLPGCSHCPVIGSFIFQFADGLEDSFSDEKLAWSKGNYSLISEELLEFDWEIAFQGLEVGECYEMFLGVLDGSVKRHIPKQKPKTTRGWLCKPPRALMRQRNVLWRQFKACRRQNGRHHSETIDRWEQYREVNISYRNHAKFKQSQFEMRAVNLLKEAPKVFHSYIRERKKGCPAVGPLKDADGTLVHNSYEISELFRKAFISVYVPDTPSSPCPYQQASTTMGELSVNCGSVLEVLLSLDGSSSPGIDGVHPMLLKSCAHAVVVPLTLIFQRSLTRAELPYLWKVSKVSPIFKSGTKYCPLNYRPVSLTSVCCKVMERLLAGHITEYLEGNQLLSSKQYGFRKGHSTEDQLLIAYSGIVAAVDRGDTAEMIYLDFSKAFDVVNHAILLEKLRSLGFCDQVLEWVRGFLCGRSMCVSVAGVVSRCSGVLSGVPQGSVLGPVLFLVYVNTLAEQLSCECFAFADDFKLYVTPSRGNSAQSHPSSLQEDLNKMEEIASSWNLKLNPSKCVVVKFGVNSGGRGGTSGYWLGGSELRLVSSHRDLGVVVDGTLKFHEHINGVVNKAWGLANQLLRCTVNRSPSFMVSLFVSHIRPILDYCSPVWNLGYIGDVKRLESVQRRWTREISEVNRFDYHSRLLQLELYSVQGRMLRADLIKVWKAFNCEVDVGLSGIFDRRSHAATRGHR